MYEMLKHAHSGLRWIVLITLILALVNAFMKWQSGKEWTKKDQQKNLFALISSHLQLLLGLALMFIVKSPKVNFDKEAIKNSDAARFFSIEHMSMMIIAIIVITIGYSISKRANTDLSKFKKTFWFYLIALIIILYAIPWPFQQHLGASWF